jgi:hypothetical protein
VPGKDLYCKKWFPFIEKTDVARGYTARPDLDILHLLSRGNKFVYTSHSSHSTGCLSVRLLKENNFRCRIISITSYSNFILINTMFFHTGYVHSSSIDLCHCCTSSSWERPCIICTLEFKFVLLGDNYRRQARHGSNSSTRQDAEQEIFPLCGSCGNATPRAWARMCRSIIQ